MRNCVATISGNRHNGTDRLHSACPVGGSVLCRLGIGALVLGGVALFGADWRDKPSTDWTADEVTKILNDSPWAQQVHMERGEQGRGGDWSGRNGGGGGGGWGGRGGGMGGPGGGGGGGWGGNRGGRQGGGQSQGGSRQVLIRWQSAAPVQQALAKQQGSSAAPVTPEAAAPTGAQAQAPAATPDADYIIAVAGLPEWPGRRKQEAGGDNSGQSDEDRRQAFLDRMKQSTTLTAKGKSPLGPEKVERAADGTILFYFPKSEQPLSQDDGDVEFATRLGPMDLKHKFRLKDMKYQGKLAL